MDRDYYCHRRLSIVVVNHRRRQLLVVVAADQTLSAIDHRLSAATTVDHRPLMVAVDHHRRSLPVECRPMTVVNRRRLSIVGLHRRSTSVTDHHHWMPPSVATTIAVDHRSMSPTAAAVGHCHRSPSTAIDHRSSFSQANNFFFLILFLSFLYFLDNPFPFVKELLYYD